jgi:hypothetical protein
MRATVAWDVAGARSGRFRHRSRRAGGVVRPLRGSDRTTVWSCGQGDSRLGGWWPDVVVRAVTAYSMPGDRVLLASAGRYGGLHDTAWTVIRLGRGVRTQTVGRCDGSMEPYDDAFKVVIAAIGPESVGAVRPTRLGAAVVPGGVLVVMTHAVWGDRQLCDPGGGLVRAAVEDGLWFVDHVVALRSSTVRGYVDAYVFGRRDVG